MWTYQTIYSSCHCRMFASKCGSQDGRDSLFTTTELHSATNNIYGYIISDYILIKSRCTSLHENSVLCPYHRYFLCEGYVPERYCVRHYYCNTTDLMQMGARTALFIGNVAILGYICSKHRAYYEEQMRRQNQQPVIITLDGWYNIWDCVSKAPPINTEPTLSEKSSPSVANQYRCDDRSFYYKSLNNDTKKNEIHLTLRTKEDENSLERSAHANQQHELNASMLVDNLRVIQVTETNQKGHQTRKSTRQSSSSKSSNVESMETQRSIRIKICASPSTSDEWQTTSMLDTDTFATLKAEIIERFVLKHCFSDLSLLYALSYSEDIHWKTLEKEEENRTLIEYSFNDGCIVTCASSKSLEKESTCAPHDVQQPNSTTSQPNVYPLPGLQNLGNTCFMNSALQCLNHVQSFFNYFRGTEIKTLLDSESIVKEENSILTRLYSKLIEYFCSPHDGADIPDAFHTEFGRLTPHFFNYHQHDSLEFLNILLDILHEGLMQILQQNHTVVSKTFHGQIRTVVTCQTCKENLTTDDSFSFLPLPIPEEEKNIGSTRTRGYKLDQCFQTFLQGEHIGNYGQWYCEHCGQLTHAHKKLSLRELPSVLILQLKRFNYDLRSNTKINTLIEYDLDNLDLNEHVVQSHQDTSIRYNLIAVSNHWGSLIGGHFVTYAKLPGTQDWYEYNDDRVGKVDKNVHVNNYSAYILVYERKKKEPIIGTPV